MGILSDKERKFPSAGLLGPMELDDELRKRVTVLRPGGRADLTGLRSVLEGGGTPTQALTNLASQQRMEGIPRAAVAGGTEVEDRTPGLLAEPQAPYQAQAEEAKGRSRFFSSLSNVLGDPNAQAFLGQLGMAFAGNRPGQPGTILGQAAVEGAQRQMEAGMISRMLAGEDPGEVVRDYPLATPEVRMAAFGQLREQRALELEERKVVAAEAGTESLITAREASVLNDQQRLELEKMKTAFNIRQFDFTLDQAMFDRQLELEKLSIDQDIAQINADYKRALTAESLSRAGKTESLSFGELSSMAARSMQMLGAVQEARFYSAGVNIEELQELQDIPEGDRTDEQKIRLNQMLAQVELSGKYSGLEMEAVSQADFFSRTMAERIKSLDPFYGWTDEELLQAYEELEKKRKPGADKSVK